MPHSITPLEAARMMETATIIDVRKAPARNASGLTIPGAARLLPPDAAKRWREFEGKPVILFCVHGHEISQSASALFAENGIDAPYMAGGFEAWRAAGLPVAKADSAT